MSEALAVALTGLGANKLRSGLTILGLMIGVGSVIVLIAVGTGSSSAVQSQIDALGSNTLTVTAAPTSRRPVRRRLELGPDAGRRRRAQQPLRGAGRQERRAGRQHPSVTLTYGSSTYEPSTFVGTTPSYEQARDYSIAEGRWFTKAQVKDHANVLVVGPTVVTELFGGADPVGDNVQINGTGLRGDRRHRVQGLERLDGPRRHRDRAADGRAGPADRLRRASTRSSCRPSRATR